VFATRETRDGLDIAFTDRWGGVSSGAYATLDLTRQRAGATEELQTNWSLLAEAFGVAGFVTMRQVHGAEVVTVRGLADDVPVCDALVTTTRDVALCVRVGDCAPVVLADAGAGVVGVAHVGRPGVTVGVVAATIEEMRQHGARTIEAWIGPHVCGGCYEVPETMRSAVAQVEPAAYAWTTWGTPSVDIGAAVAAQQRRHDCTSIHPTDLCTRESDDFFSYRRQGPQSGRQGGLVVLRGTARGGPA
jgi:YfiH family protein